MAVIQPVRSSNRTRNKTLLKTFWNITEQKRSRFFQKLHTSAALLIQVEHTGSKKVGDIVFQRTSHKRCFSLLHIRYTSAMCECMYHWISIFIVHTKHIQCSSNCSCFEHLQYVINTIVSHTFKLQVFVCYKLTIRSIIILVKLKFSCFYILPLQGK